jgi:hypothetical protein
MSRRRKCSSTSAREQGRTLLRSAAEDNRKLRELDETLVNQANLPSVKKDFWFIVAARRNPSQARISTSNAATIEMPRGLWINEE